MLSLTRSLGPSVQPRKLCCYLWLLHHTVVMLVRGGCLQIPAVVSTRRREAAHPCPVWLYVLGAHPIASLRHLPERPQHLFCREGLGSLDRPGRKNSDCERTLLFMICSDFRRCDYMRSFSRSHLHLRVALSPYLLEGAQPPRTGLDACPRPSLYQLCPISHCSTRNMWLPVADFSWLPLSERCKHSLIERRKTSKSVTSDFCLNCFWVLGMVNCKLDTGEIKLIN